MLNERVYTGRAKRSGTSKQASAARQLACAQLPSGSTDAISLRTYWGRRRVVQCLLFTMLIILLFRSKLVSMVNFSFCDCPILVVCARR